MTAKSTLIGRLLYDSNGVYEDQLASVRHSPINRSSGAFDLALLTDGLRAEREQGITIDVAYRYFSTPKRKFIIADTPGHEQYTRNMATGASTAHLAIILIDARYGVLQQSRRHAFIASLLGIQHIVVAVNKMDLVGYAEEVFDQIRSELRGLCLALAGARSSLHPDQRSRRAITSSSRAERMPWYRWFQPAALSGDCARRERPQPDGLSLPGAVCHPPRSRFPRLRRPSGLRRGQTGRSGYGTALRAAQPGEIDGYL